MCPSSLDAQLVQTVYPRSYFLAIGSTLQTTDGIIPSVRSTTTSLSSFRISETFGTTSSIFETHSPREYHRFAIALQNLPQDYSMTPDALMHPSSSLPFGSSIQSNFDFVMVHLRVWESRKITRALQNMRNQSVRRPAFLHHLDLRSTLLHSLVFRALSHQAIAVLLHTQFSVLLLALSTILAHIFRLRVLFRFRLRLRTSIMVLDLVFGLGFRLQHGYGFNYRLRSSFSV